jgi:hypothetical protein
VWSPSDPDPQYVTIGFGITDLVTEDSPLLYYYDETSGEKTQLTLGVHYDIQDASTNNFVIKWTDQAPIDFPVAGHILIFRDTDLAQDTEYVEGDSFPVKTMERSLDKLTMNVQDLFSDLAQTIRVPRQDTFDELYAPTSLNDLPDRDNRKEKYLYFDIEGEPTAVSAIDTESLPFSTIGEALAIATSEANARGVIDAAYINGDSGEIFKANEPVDPSDVATKNYVDTTLVPTEKPNLINLLDNSQFIVNQKGQTTYIGTPANPGGITFDRWNHVYAGTTNKTIELDADDLSVLKWKNIGEGTTIGSEDWVGLKQAIDGSVYRAFADKQVTVEFYIKSSVFNPGTTEFYPSISTGFYAEASGFRAQSYVYNHTITTGNWEHVTFTVDFSSINLFSIKEGELGVYFYIMFDSGSNYEASALETWLEVDNPGDPPEIAASSTIASETYKYSGTIRIDKPTIILGEHSPSDVEPLVSYTTVNEEINRCLRHLYVCNYRGLVAAYLSASYWAQRKIILGNIPFPQRMARVPDISGGESGAIEFQDITNNYSINDILEAPVTRDNGSLFLELNVGLPSDIKTALIIDIEKPFIFDAEPEQI